MANKRISTLDDISLVGGTSTPGLTTSDIIPVTDVDDTTGSLDGTTKKVTVANLVAVAPVQSVNTATGAVVLDADDIDDASTSHKFVTSSDITNLGNLSGTNTGDQDLSTYQLQPAEGAFVDGDKTKLDGIEASADVTDATNVQAAGALMDNEVTNLAQVKAFDSSNYATSAQGGLADTAVQPAGIANMVETTDSIDVLSDVDTSTVAPTTNDFLKWGGSNWVPAVPTADVDTPLTTALRGTDNPHIGAFPNQSFKVIDNPKKLVMVIATDSGDLDFLLPDGGSIFLNTPTGGRLAPGFGFSVQEDATEPDIEVASGGENYSVISGDSDTKGPNGLPIRQGFNLPDIGANPAPLLISGGSIA